MTMLDRSLTSDETIDAANLQAATYVLLTAQATSAACVELRDRLAAEVMPPVTGKRPTRLQREALGSILADLMERDPAVNGGWVYRELSSGSFTGEKVGYKLFTPAFRGLRASGLIEVIDGQPRFAKSEFTGNRWVALLGTATRFRATDSLREAFAAVGITHATWGEHFARVRPTQARKTPAVELRPAKVKRAGTKERRRNLPVPKDPTAQAIVARVERINDFLAAQSIEPYGPVRLKRVFNDVDDPDFAWNIGGRLTAPGRTSYQTAKKKDRASILINGEAVTEIDVRACHLTIMVGLGHLSASVLDPDPYSVEGLPRELVKAWFTMTLGYGKRHRQWSEKAASSLLAEGIDVKDYPLRSVGDAILKTLPVLQGEGATTAVGWGELQFHESEMLLQAMETLAFGHGVVGLPVHDSLIVPVEARGLAMEVMKDTFVDRLGVEPTLT